MRTYDHPKLFNFRDVGGYAGLDGRTVRWRRLFRSDSLSRLDETDAASFAEFGVRTVIDLRRPRELAHYGRVPDFAGVAYHHIHPQHAEWEETTDPDELSDARWLANRYLDLTDEGAAAMVAAIRVIADAANAPVVVHCMAGKDRTGVVVALTLSALGVGDDDVAADYALTAVASQRWTAWWRRENPGQPELPTRYQGAPVEAMHLFLGDLRQRHGSVRRYLTAAGLTDGQLAALETNLLEG